MPATRSSNRLKKSAIISASDKMKSQAEDTVCTVMLECAQLDMKISAFTANSKKSVKGSSARLIVDELQETSHEGKAKKSGDVYSKRKKMVTCTPPDQKTAAVGIEKQVMKQNNKEQGADFSAIKSCNSDFTSVRKRKSVFKLPEIASKKSVQIKLKETMVNKDLICSEVEMTAPSGGLKIQPNKHDVEEEKQITLQTYSSKSLLQEKNSKLSNKPLHQAVEQNNQTVEEKSSAKQRNSTRKDTPRIHNRKKKDDSLIIMTEDSSGSASDFEAVQNQFRTPESSNLSSVYSDLGICRRLENNFSDIEICQDLSSSFSSNSELSLPVGATGLDSVNSGMRMPQKKAPATNKILAGNGLVERLEHELVKGKKKQATKVSNSGSSASPKKVTNDPARENDIMALLMQMEGRQVVAGQTVSENVPSTSGQYIKKPNKKVRKAVNSDSSEESHWEEVEDYHLSPVKSQVPSAPIQITIEDPGMLHKKRKKGFDLQAYVQRRIKRLAKEVQVNVHKVHLLCLLAHGMHQNSFCSDVTLCATALSVVPEAQCPENIANFDSASLLLLVKWYRSAFSISKVLADEGCSLVSSSQLVSVISDRNTSEARQLVMVMVSMLRSLGFNVRLVMSLHPVPFKSSQMVSSKSMTKQAQKYCCKKSNLPSRKMSHQKAGKKDNKKPSKSKPKAFNSVGLNAKQIDLVENPKVKRKKAPKKVKDPELDFSTSESESDSEMIKTSYPKRRTTTRLRKRTKPLNLKKGMNDALDEALGDDTSDGSNFSDEEDMVKLKARRSSQTKGRKFKEENLHKTSTEDEESDAEFHYTFSVKSLTVRDGERQKKTNRKILSSDSSPERPHKSKGQNYWLEVFLPGESKWVCVDCIRSAVGKPYDLGIAASQPLLYVLSFENDGSVKDITSKYASKWLSHTRKQRVDFDWWRESLEPYASPNKLLDDQENESIKDQLMQRPLPTSIGDYKNHPLYVLRRHLLKFEAIYPESSVPVGYIRHEPVYARECVHTLHSRENWLREARVVRLGETAFKMVKSRKRWNRMRDNSEELDLELFGIWQTEDYIPPPAVNGKVPKNEYGNVELFKPTMLPGGTVHVRVPGLNRVAKKLGIDIAAAMTGWDHHCGFSHPVLDGWVVCKEHKGILLAAWKEDQKIQRQRAEERQEKRVLNNWTTLVRGLLIKDKLKRRFSLEDKKSKTTERKEASSKKGEMATDLQHAWPAKRQHAQKSKESLQPSHFKVETM